MQGPARPKHPDGERLFPYQSGNTAPPPHPLYKKHDSTVPKKCRKTSQTPGFVKSPLNSFYRKRKIQENRAGERGRGGGEREREREKNEEGVKQSTRPWDLFFYLFLHRLRKVCISKIERGEWGGWGSGVPKNGTQNKTPGKQRDGGDGGGRRRLRLFYTNPLNRDEMKARGDGWRRMVWWESGKEKQQAGEWVSEWATSASTATRQSPK